jgi:hypothetical protein
MTNTQKLLILSVIVGALAFIILTTHNENKHRVTQVVQKDYAFVLDTSKIPLLLSTLVNKNGTLIDSMYVSSYIDVKVKKVFTTCLVTTAHINTLEIYKRTIEYKESNLTIAKEQKDLALEAITEYQENKAHLDSLTNLINN